MDHTEADDAPSEPPLTWRRWFLAALAGTTAYFVAQRTTDLILGPGQTGNTGLYAAMAIGLVAGTVAAALVSRARSPRRWIAALLVTLLPVLAIGAMLVAPWMFRVDV